MVRTLRKLGLKLLIIENSDKNFKVPGFADKKKFLFLPLNLRE